eukprot:786987-Rhodomonas_salina.1
MCSMSGHPTPQLAPSSVSAATRTELPQSFVHCFLFRTRPAEAPKQAPESFALPRRRGEQAELPAAARRARPRGRRRGPAPAVRERGDGGAAKSAGKMGAALLAPLTGARLLPATTRAAGRRALAAGRAQPRRPRPPPPPHLRPLPLPRRPRLCRRVRVARRETRVWGRGRRGRGVARAGVLADGGDAAAGRQGHGAPPPQAPPRPPPPPPLPAPPPRSPLNSSSSEETSEEGECGRNGALCNRLA